MNIYQVAERWRGHAVYAQGGTACNFIRSASVLDNE
jgi:hypothetical protein